MNPKHSTIPLVMLLLLSAVASSQIPAIAAKMPTEITIDDVPTKVRPGDRVTLTGTVLTAEGEPVSRADVSIYILTSEPRLIGVASGVTGLEGAYTLVWDVKLLPVYRPSNDVTKQVSTQVFLLFAQFEGNDRFASSRTGKSTVTIELNSVKTLVNADKKVYSEGESATIFINFVDADDQFVDPDHINSSFNLVPVADQFEKKKPGSYTFVTPPLKTRHNQITVVPIKEGYNIETEVMTITMTGKGSQGIFEFP